MKARLTPAFVIILAVVTALFSSPQRIRERDLSEKYRDWLDLTSYIILPAERDVFLQLQTDRDRDLFIESFWKQRDPTPETPQNELKEEHVRRFLYANTHLRRATPREGWRTDMGRMHIILGPPTSIERFDSQQGVHPCQVWYYHSEGKRGLPALFALVFYQRRGSGEYKLYNPAADGPASLLVKPEELDMTDPGALYEKIRELTPSLAPVVLSIIPGEVPFNYMPSPQNNILLANIIESPRKDVNPRYATDFLNFKGMVSTEYLMNYVESSAVVALIPDPVLDVDLLHFSASPKRVSVDYYSPKNQFYCNFKLNVSLKKGEEIIFQYEKDFPLYFPPDRRANIEANGVAVEDVFPVAEGEYTLSLLLQNSVGKEFSFIERRILVPPRGGAAVQLIGPLLGYRLQTVSTEALRPFTALDRQISVDSSDTLSRQDELALLFTLADVPESLWRDGRARVMVKGLKKERASGKELAFALSELPYKKTMIFSRGIPIADLDADYYEVALAILDGQGKVLQEKTANIILAALENISHPVTLILPTPPSQNHLLYYGLAYQYDKVSRPDRAEAFYEKALALDPAYVRGVVEYAGFLVKHGRFDKALAVAERARDDENLRFQYLLITGMAHMGKKEYDRAIPLFLEGNKIYNSDVQLLNSLGNSYYFTGKKKEALDALNASLRLNPEQKEVKALIDRINRELK
ncbi:MAG: hypothetical protein A2Y86_02785 [Candidatus Aminicenantes bacterium RBG_13_62_12]|nr:MAG: hypothetical protein A2Y86_02785 [Candidatus Aminicenantes bacterium RBG_13_62_12]